MADPKQEVYIDYVNWRGIRGYRRIRPGRVVFENNEWHPETEWLLEAVDCEKGQERTFALAKIREWFTAAEIDAAKALVKEKASTSFLQRKLRIGYNRAASIMQMFEDMGIVSKPSASGVRTAQ